MHHRGQQYPLDMEEGIIGGMDKAEPDAPGLPRVVDYALIGVFISIALRRAIESLCYSNQPSEAHQRENEQQCQ